MMVVTKVSMTEAQYTKLLALDENCRNACVDWFHDSLGYRPYTHSEWGSHIFEMTFLSEEDAALFKIKFL